jgi:hypothetical protein
MLRLQQYERLMKALLVDHEIAGEIYTVKQARAKRVNEFATDTLGLLVKKLFGSFVVADEAHKSMPKGRNVAPNAPAFSYRISLQMSAADYAQVVAELEDLVNLRNRLVHHFIDHFDLWSVDGCAAAQVKLSEHYARIDEHCNRLQCWDKQMNEAKSAMLDEMRTPAFLNLLVDSRLPGETIESAIAGIVCALREAAAELAIDGWTRLDDAVAFVVERYPAQTPDQYGCRSWKQVLHESRIFELRYRTNGGDSRFAWFRERRA